MLDLLAAAAVVLVLTAVAALVLVAVGVAPLVVAGGLAERRGASPARTGAAALLGVLVGLGGAALVVRSDLPTPLAVLPLAVCWATPLALRLAGDGAGALAGTRGAHEA